MSALTVAMDVAAKTLVVTGTACVGEKVDVTLIGFSAADLTRFADGDDSELSEIRFRLVDPCGRDLARFPVELDSEDAWTFDGDSLYATVDFNTLALREYFKGEPFKNRKELGVVIDDAPGGTQIARGKMKVLQWAAASDCDPLSLPDWRKTLGDLKAAIEAVDEKTEAATSAAETASAEADSARRCAQAAQDALTGAQNAERSASAYADTARDRIKELFDRKNYDLTTNDGFVDAVIDIVETLGGQAHD